MTKKIAKKHQRKSKYDNVVASKVLKKTKLTDDQVNSGLNLLGNKYETDAVDPKILIPFDNNPRKISDEAVDAVVKSIREFGFYNPVIVNQDNVIIAGHTRTKAALKAKLKTIPIYRVTVDEKRFLAMNLFDNKSNEKAKWDNDLLASTLLELEMLDDNFVEYSGFSDKELAKLTDGLAGFEFDEPKQDKPKDVGGISDRSAAKMVQFFLNPTAFKNFVDITDHLKDHYKLENLSDAIMLSIKNTYEQTKSH